MQLLSAFYRGATWVAFVTFVERNAFPCTFQYATSAYMNIYDTACMTPHPVFQINGNFTILVRMTFICTCNCELAYYLWPWWWGPIEPCAGRYHDWQSSLLCCCVTQHLFLLHLGLWSSESDTSEIVAWGGGGGRGARKILAMLSNLRAQGGERYPILVVKFGLRTLSNERFFVMSSFTELSIILRRFIFMGF